MVSKKDKKIINNPENQAMIVSSESGSFSIAEVFEENNITYIEGE